MRIKFCGMTRHEDAEHAVALDAWAIGLILWPGSKRACDPGVAAGIARAVKRRIEVAGVFVNATLDEVVHTTDALGLTLVQLHGDEGPVFCSEVARRTGSRVVKAASVSSGAELQALRAFRTDFHLLDTGRGGTGETWDWRLVEGHRGPVPVILAGGLDPGNVAGAIAEVHPWGVDVATGIESAPGIKDHAKMDAFARAARGMAPVGETVASS